MNREDLSQIARDAEFEGRWEDAMRIRLEAHALDPRVVEIGRENPTERYSWSGKLISLDINECSNEDFVEGDIDLVLAYGDTGKGWDGEAAGIIRLKDGRWVAWESDWGPTGSGFQHDAYGGTADIAFSMSPGEVLAYISERGRELLVWA